MKVPSSYQRTAMGELALLLYMSEFRFVVLSIGNSKSNHLSAQGICKGWSTRGFGLKVLCSY